MPEVTLDELSGAAPFPVTLGRLGIVVHTEPHKWADAYMGSTAMASFVYALIVSYRAGHLHDDTALATAVARARREALEEADNREVERILGLSDAEISAEIEAEGRDPEALAEAMRGQMNATFRLCEEVKHWKEEARSWRAVAERLETEKQAERSQLKSRVAP